MDTRHPHTILPEEAVKALPPEERRAFAPIPDDAAAQLLAALSPEGRANWLAEHPLDALRLQRAKEKRERRAAQRS
jgi:hypothetical protein